MIKVRYRPHLWNLDLAEQVFSSNALKSRGKIIFWSREKKDFECSLMNVYRSLTDTHCMYGCVIFKPETLGCDISIVYQDINTAVINNNMPGLWLTTMMMTMMIIKMMTLTMCCDLENKINLSVVKYEIDLNEFLVSMKINWMTIWLTLPLIEY